MSLSRKRGLFIALLGVDGAGKTTVISALAPRLEAMEYSVEQRHLRPGWLPPLGRLFRRQRDLINEVETNPHEARPSGPFGSIIRLLYLMLDYSLGYWFIVRPSLRARRVCFLFDRYFFDLAMDPRRFRISLPDASLALTTQFLPQPDVVLCLYAEADTISARKPELSADEISRQYRRLRDVTVNRQNCIWIKTSGSIEVTVQQCLKAIQNPPQHNNLETQDRMLRR